MSVESIHYMEKITIEAAVHDVPDHCGRWISIFFTFDEKISCLPVYLRLRMYGLM